jgi:hypothetical protein
MILDSWLEQLRKATTEEAVVGFARRHLDRVTATGRIPETLRGQVLVDGEDLRRLAANLSHARVNAAQTREDADVMQQMVILFSLATDRLNQLEGSGLARRAPHRSLPLR